MSSLYIFLIVLIVLLSFFLGRHTAIIAERKMSCTRLSRMRACVWQEAKTLLSSPEPLDRSSIISSLLTAYAKAENCERKELHAEFIDSADTAEYL